MIEFKNVNFSYGELNVLKDFDLSIKKGERICLYGKSGLGKTTVLRLISGLEKAENIAINGSVSYVFQEDRLLPTTVLKNVSLVCGNEQKAAEILSLFKLGDFLNSHISELSGGMKRRVAVARALSVDKDIYLLDEAFSGIDNQNIKIITDYINENLQKKTIIMVSHNKADAKLINAKIINL